jgi:hypothetical protein
MKAREGMGAARHLGLAARAAAVAVAILAIALPAMSCTSLLGVSEIELPADACIADGDSNDPCYLCEDQACCAQELACQESSDCQTYKASLKACVNEGNSSSQCTLQAAAQNSAGHALTAPLLACVEYHCLASCGQTQNDPCVACWAASCADLIYACDSNPDCDILDNCNQSCANAGSNIFSCMKICTNNASPTAQQLYQALYTCETKYCATACATLASDD